jgi:hypothetical protein
MTHDPGWLFRQSDLVLGPVPTKQIIDKLYSGELTPSSEVQLMGTGVFRAVSEFPELKIHLAKAAAKHRVDAQAQAHRASQKKKLVRAVVILGVVLALVGAGVAAVGRYLAVHPLIGPGAEELAWGDITVDAPTIRRAVRKSNDDLVVYNDGRSAPRPAAVAARADPPASRPERERPAAERAPPAKPKLGAEDPEGMAMGEVDEAGINAVVARHKPTLIPCIRQVARPGVVLKIPIEFAISDSGKVTRVWVDNPDLKDTGLNECLLRELQKWPFKAGSSGASVNLSFNVGKRG